MDFLAAIIAFTTGEVVAKKRQVIHGGQRLARGTRLLGLGDGMAGGEGHGVFSLLAEAGLEILYRIKN